MSTVLKQSSSPIYIYIASIKFASKANYERGLYPRDSSIGLLLDTDKSR